MNDFIRKYQDQLQGALSGFDRLVFRGTLRKDALTGMKAIYGLIGLGRGISEVMQKKSPAS